MRRTMMLCAVALLLISISAPAWCQTLDSIPDLKKPVSLAVKGEALSDIMEALEKQTGVHLRAAQGIADQKATIFVDEQPLNEVMSGLTKLFGYRWRTKDVSGESVFELWEDEKSRRQRKAESQRGLDKAFEKIEADSKWLLGLAALEYEEYSRLVDEAREKKDDKAYTDLTKVQNRDIMCFARLYSTFNPKLRQAFRDGAVVCFDTDSPEPEWVLPREFLESAQRCPIEPEPELNSVPFSLCPSVSPDGLFDRELEQKILEQMRKARKEQKEQPPPRINVQYACTARSGEISIVQYQVERNADGDGGVGRDVIITKKFDASLMRSRDRLPHAPGATILDKKFSVSGEDIADASDLPKRALDEHAYLNRSDALELLHDKVGLQIISDHYSHWLRWSIKGDTTGRQVLDVFRLLDYTHDTAITPGCEAFWGWDGSFLYSRAKNTYWCDVSEVPNRLLESWQAVYAEKGGLGLTQALQMADLAEEQRMNLWENSWNLQIDDDNRSTMIPRNANVRKLRLYKSLTQSQMEAAASGGLDIRSLTPEQMPEIAPLLSMWGSETMIDAEDRFVVGVYKDGWRIDRPQAKPLVDLNESGYAALNMSYKTRDGKYVFFVNPGDPSTLRELNAGSLQDAWKEAQRLRKDARIEDLFGTRWESLGFGLVKTDGTTQGLGGGMLDGLAYRTRIPYARLAKTAH